MKTDFLDYLNKRGVLFLDGETKTAALNAMISRASELCRVPFDILQEAVWERENKISTGLGNGLALPHVRLTCFGEPVIVVGISYDGINDYQTTDETVIDTVVLLIADGRDTDLYLELMKSIILKLKSRSNIEKLQECGKDLDKIVALLKKL